MSEPDEVVFRAPEDPERYLECPRCGHTFDREAAQGSECPGCRSRLFTQIVLPGTDELALRRERRKRRRA